MKTSHFSSKKLLQSWYFIASSCDVIGTPAAHTEIFIQTCRCAKWIPGISISWLLMEMEEGAGTFPKLQWTRTVWTANYCVIVLLKMKAENKYIFLCIVDCCTLCQVSRVAVSWYHHYHRWLIVIAQYHEWTRKRSGHSAGQIQKPPHGGATDSKGSKVCAVILRDGI